MLNRKNAEMETDDGNRPAWRFVDGSISVSMSMLVAVALNSCTFCQKLPLLAFLNELSSGEDGVIIVATLLLFPTTVAIYGGFKMFFAAKEAVEKKARERGRKEGRNEERERISKILEQQGVSLTPELVRTLSGEPDERS